MTNRNCRFETFRLCQTRLALPVLASILAFAGCTDRASQAQTDRQVGAAVDKTEQAAAAAASKAAQLADTARDKTVAYLGSPHVKQDAAAAKDAFKNAAAGITSSSDDAAITVSVSSALAKDGELHAAGIDIQTKDGTVRLAGAAPSAAAKARAGEIARSVKGVASVDNELEIKSM